MIASTRKTTALLNELARRRRVQLGLSTRPNPPPPCGAVCRRPSATVGDQVLTRRNDRRNRPSKTDFVKNGDRWTVLEVGPHGGLRVQHQRNRRVT